MPEVHPASRRLAEFVLRRRWPVLVGLALVTALFAFQIPRIALRISPEGMVVLGHPDTLYYAHYVEEFGTDEIVLIELFAQDVFSSKVLATVFRLTEQIQGYESVKRVLSLASVNDIRGSPEGVEIAPFLTGLPETADELEAVRAQVHANPLLSGNLVSRDDRCTLVLVELDLRKEDFPEKRKELVRRILELVDRERTEEVEFYVAGFPVVSTVLTTMLIEDQRVFVPTIALLIVLTLCISFRSFWGVLLPMLTIAVSLIWVLGFLVLAGKTVEIITNVLPPLILVIAIADSVHILAHYQEELEGNGNPQEVLLDATAYILTPCFLTSLTTAIGFGSLMVSRVEGIRNLGLLASFGALAAFVISITLVPILLSLLPARSVRRQVRRRRSVLDRVLACLAGFNESNQTRVLLATFFFVVVAVTGLFRLKVETTLIEYLKDGNPLVRAVRHIESHLTGTSTLDVVFTFDGPEAVKEPGNLAKVEELARHLLARPVVTDCFSLADILKRMNQVFHGGDPFYYRLPESREEIAQYLLLYSMSGEEEDLARYVDDDYQTAVLTSRLKTVSSAQMDRFIREVKEHIRREFPELDIEVTGISVLVTDSIDAIVRGQTQSLGLAVGIISLIMVALLGSFRLGLLSMVPTVIPILGTLGLMGWVGIPINTATAVISCVAIGIAVDDTIHYMSRFRKEFLKEPNEAVAAFRSLTSTGRAMYLTSFILTAGFLVLVFSHFKPIIYFGFLMAVTMVSALAGDMILLPVLLMVLKPIRRGKA
jgi:predicted RND superfamily exporter protein